MNTNWQGARPGRPLHCPTRTARKYYSVADGQSRSTNSIPVFLTSCVPVFLIKLFSMAETHKGGCYCGAVEIEVRGEPLEVGYCHCDNCRRYSAAPVSAFTLWKWENVNLVKGADFLGKFNSSEISDRRYCTKCGSHISVDHPTLGLIDVRDRRSPEFSVQTKGAPQLRRDHSSNERWIA